MVGQAQLLYRTPKTDHRTAQKCQLGEFEDRSHEIDDDSGLFFETCLFCFLLAACNNYLKWLLGLSIFPFRCFQGGKGKKNNPWWLRTEKKTAGKGFLAPKSFCIDAEIAFSGKLYKECFFFLFGKWTPMIHDAHARRGCFPSTRTPGRCHSRGLRKTFR